MILHAIQDLQQLSPTQQWLIVGAIAVTVWSMNAFYLRQRTWVDVPSLGREGIFDSYITALTLTKSWQIPVRENYTKFKGGFFKVPDLFGWQVIVCDPKLTEEVMKFPDDVLSAMAAADISLQADYTLGPNIHSNLYHAAAVQHNLTRSLGFLFPEMLDEVRCSFDEEIPQPKYGDDGWRSFPALETAMRLMCRVSNRTFVGLPLCRNKNYMDINIKFTIDVIVVANLLKLLPTFLRPIAGRLISRLPKRHKAVMKYVKPMVEERYRALEAHNGEWDSVPNDFLTFLMQHAEGIEKTPGALVYRLLIVNFASIHTTSSTFAWVLFHLAALPEYIPELRQEIESAIEEDGWSKTAMTRCRKLDSFIKETMRLYPIGAILSQRVALKDVRLSTGVVIKKGTMIGIPTEALQRDPKFYGSDADTFDGYRFSKARASSEKESLKHQLVFNNSEFVAFGAGRHACPGRFFAANELKLLTSHLLTNFDIKFADPSAGTGLGAVPKARWFASGCIPDDKIGIMIKKR